MKISAVIIAFNEERKIRECLSSIEWVDEIILVDNFSTDKTCEIALNYGAKVVQKKFNNFAEQKNFAVSLASNEWVLSIDADESISEALQREIISLPKNNNFDAYSILRRNIIFAREFKYGGHQIDRHVRLFKKSKGHFSGLIHEKIFIGDNTRIGFLNMPLIHYSTSNITEYIKKLNLYTDFESDNFTVDNKIFKKNDIIFKPLAVFLKRYIWQRGFLDGKEGFIFYFLSAFYCFMKYSKIWEKQKGVARKLF
ncbi:family 2 glycosyl transferase [Candidatus Omnitrophus magneticus]|uniref:Family 2 glycosyl transferase n=1 Tax=Candidatus Omnitrophus magneticus TaxID=1609969 RepID=A0A0F0CV01_9BACT|nr:family 2 glycosyl transferase [Candidatus Omnitrophus magneticus]